MATYNVSTQRELDSAIEKVSDGDTILLAGGDYDLIKMQTGRYQDHSFKETVTIASANQNDPAVVAELYMSKVDNVTFRGITFDYERDKSSSKPFFAELSSDLTFDEVTFQGETIGGYGAGTGLRIKDSQHVVVTDSEFHDFQNAVSFSALSDVALLDNEIRGMSSDGFTFGGMDGILIAGNDFRDYKSPDPYSLHKDHIQFRTGPGEDASNDVAIRDNVMVDDEQRHGVYMGNEAYRAGDDDAIHTNVVIENNYLSTSHTHGITVFGADGVEIRDNTLVKNPDQSRSDGVYTPLINVSTHSVHVDIEGNVVASVQDPANGSWTVRDNHTSGKTYLHWDGDSELSSFANRVISHTSAHHMGSAITRIDADDLSGVETARLADFDFSDGDTIYLHGFDRGTFEGVSGGNALDIWDDGGAVLIDSALDLQELSDTSGQVTGRTDGDELTLYAFQGEDELRLELSGMANAWQAANQHDLY